MDSEYAREAARLVRIGVTKSRIRRNEEKLLNLDLLPVLAQSIRQKITEDTHLLQKLEEMAPQRPA